MINLSTNTLPRRPVTFSHGKGEWFWDTRGCQYMDLSSQTLNLIWGQAHPRVTAAVTDVLARYTFVTQDFDSPDHRRAMEALYPLLPPALTRFNLRMNDASSGVECAVKQARRATNRRTVLTTRGIYLGQNAQVIHFRGLGERPMDILQGGSEDVIFAPLPYCREPHPAQECLAESGETLVELVNEHAHRLACVLLDPIMISSGVCGGKDMPALLRRMSAACRAAGVPLVLDECQSFGWVPDYTLSAHWGIDVDMLVLGKGVAAGFPLSVCASRPEFDNLAFAEADYTHGGHPASIAAMRAACELLADPAEARRFAELQAVMDEVLGAAAAARAPRVETRGVGLIRAVQLRYYGEEEDRRAAQRVAAACLDRGVYVRPYGDTLCIKPPRVCRPDSLRWGVQTLFEAIDEVAAPVSGGTGPASRAAEPALA